MFLYNYGYNIPVPRQKQFACHLQSKRNNIVLQGSYIVGFFQSLQEFMRNERHFSSQKPGAILDPSQINIPSADFQRNSKCCQSSGSKVGGILIEKLLSQIGRTTYLICFQCFGHKCRTNVSTDNVQSEKYCY